MNAGHLQAQLAEEATICGGVAGGVTERLDAGITSRGHLADHALEVVSELCAQRIELQGEGRSL